MGKNEISAMRKSHSYECLHKRNFGEHRLADEQNT